MSAFPRRRAVATALAVSVIGLLIATSASAKPPREDRGAVPSPSRPPSRHRHAHVVAGQPRTDPGQPALARANELLAALTTDQKIQLALGNFADLSSFGVPTLTFDDGPDGIRNPGTTAMPSGQAIAATFDRALAFAYGSVVGAEARGEGSASGPRRLKSQLRRASPRPAQLR
jgi:beta-glucosidase